MRWPVLLQRWHAMTFLHWRYEPAAVQPLLPPGLTLDLFDGAAWVGLTPFLMTDVRAPGLPAVPGLSTFPETNLRTYVRGPDGLDGLWFLSLDAASVPTTLGGRVAYGVPYHWATMSVSEAATLRYRSRRRTIGGVGHDIVVAPGAAYAPPELTERDHWLTGRWRAYGRLAGRFTRTPVEHQPWPLQSAEVVELEETLTSAAGLAEPAEPPLVHFSPGVDVRLGAPRPLLAR